MNAVQIPYFCTPVKRRTHMSRYTEYKALDLSQIGKDILDWWKTDNGRVWLHHLNREEGDNLTLMRQVEGRIL